MTGTGGGSPTYASRSPIAATSAASTACRPRACPGASPRRSSLRGDRAAGSLVRRARDRGRPPHRWRAPGPPRLPRAGRGCWRRIEGIRDLSLTTNGYLLERHAEALVGGRHQPRQRLDRLPPARPLLPAHPARRPAQVLRGLEAIAAYPEVRPIKVNAVAMRGFTEAEVERFCHFARSVTSFQVRFIEFMPLDADRAWTPESVLAGEELRGMIEALHPLEELPREPSATARVFRFADGRGEVGFVNPVTRTVLRRMQPGAPDLRGQAADLPLLDPGDRPARAAARRRERRRAGRPDPRGGLAQGAEAPGQRAGLPPAGADDERDRGLSGDGDRNRARRQSDDEQGMGRARSPRRWASRRRARPSSTTC